MGKFYICFGQSARFLGDFMGDLLLLLLLLLLLTAHEAAWYVILVASACWSV